MNLEHVYCLSTLAGESKIMGRCSPSSNLEAANKIYKVACGFVLPDPFCPKKAFASFVHQNFRYAWTLNRTEQLVGKFKI